MLEGAHLEGVLNLAMAEIRERSKLVLYQSDPEAWVSDVLGRRWWSKQAEVAQSFVDNKYTVVKSANGTGKSFLAADLATWMVSVHDPSEVNVILTGPSFQTIRSVVFNYIGNNYSTAALNGLKLPGRFVGDASVLVDRPLGDAGKPFIVVQGKKPPDKDIVSAFQGIHNKYVVVLIDEGGGIHEDLWTAADAVTTGPSNKIFAIGNPDHLHSHFYDIFHDRDRYRMWNTYTISAFDTPKFTGEIVYPNDKERQRALEESGMIDPEWAADQKLAMHPNVYRAKILGEFPLSDETSFFAQEDIDRANDTVVDPIGDEPKILGVDLAWSGSDKSAAYLNQGGRIRQVETWNHIENPVDIGAKINGLAVENGVSEVHLDASGGGDLVYSYMQATYGGEPYAIIGMLGGGASPDNMVWKNQRAWAYDMFRRDMKMGKIDLDLDNDKRLRDELQAQTAKDPDAKGAMVMPSKRDMRSAGIHSPDELDAAIYAHSDANGYFEAVAEKKIDKATLVPTDDLVVDGFGELNESWLNSPGMPL